VSPPADGTPLLRRRGILLPFQARRSVAWTFTLPPGAGALRLGLTFSPPTVDRVRNLLTLTLFDPAGFRGAGHRHAPRQEVLVAPDRATPGFVPGPLSPGPWTVELDCHCVLPSDSGGVEYELEVDSLPALPDSAEALVPSQPAAPPSGAVAGAAPRWLRGDLHLHSTHSDGRWSVEEIVDYARMRRLDFLAVTEHNTSSALPELRAAAARAAPPLVVVPGIELTTFWGHANALGVPGWVDWRVAPPVGFRRESGDDSLILDDPAASLPETGTMAAAAAAVHEQGGTFVVNHPRSIGYPDCTGCRWEFGDDSAGYADLLEVWNGPWRRQNVEGLALWDAWLNAGRRLPACAGSDGHLRPQRWDTVGLTCVFAVPEPGAILAAARAGASYLTSGPVLLLRDPAPGARLPADADAVSLTVADLPGPADVYLVADGARVARRSLRGDGELRLPLPAGSVRWCRVELYAQGRDVPLALSNAIFPA